MHVEDDGYSITCKTEKLDILCEGWVIMLFHWGLRTHFRRFQWAWKYLELMLRSTNLNTLGITSYTFYCDLLCRAAVGNGTTSRKKIVVPHTDGL